MMKQEPMATRWVMTHARGKPVPVDRLRNLNATVPRRQRPEDQQQQCNLDQAHQATATSLVGALMI